MAKGSFASIFILGLFLSQVFAVPSSSFGSGDVTSAISALKAAQTKDGVYFGLKNAFFAVSGLRLLKADVPNKDKICTSVSGKGLDAESIYYVTAVQESLGCGQAADNKVKDILESALKSTKSSDLTFALASVLTLSENKHISIEQKTIEDAFKKLVAGQDDDGSFAGSVLTTGLALQALAKYAKVAKAEEKERLATVLETAVEVLSNADAGAGTLEFSAEKDASSLRVTSTYFNGLSSLATALGKKVDTKAENVAQIAEFFVQNKQSGTVEDIFAVVQGIEGVKNFHIQPLVVSLLQNFISATAKANEGNIKVQVTDISGNAVSGAKVTLNKAVNREDKKSVASNQELTGAAGEFQYNFLSNKPEVGVYDLEFSASADKFAPTKSTQSLKVVGQVTIYESRVVVSDSKDHDDLVGATKYTAEYPNTATTKVVAENNQHIHITFKLKHVASGKAAKAHQVMASLVNKATGDEVIVAATHDGSKYNAHFFVEDYADNFRGASGDYQLSVIIGDSSLQGTLTWKVGTVELRFPASAKKEVPTPFGAKPEIQHRFREPEKRPSLAISSAFSLAVLAPWAILFIGFIAVKANIGNFPTGGGFIWAVGYQATLGAILALYALYWLSLNMVQTLTYLSILALPYLFFSQRALNYLATQNAKSKRE